MSGAVTMSKGASCAAPQVQPSPPPRSGTPPLQAISRAVGQVGVHGVQKAQHTHGHTQTHPDTYTRTHTGVYRHFLDGKALEEGGGVSPRGPPRKQGGSAAPPGPQGTYSPGGAVCPESVRLGWQERLDPPAPPPRSPRPPCQHGVGGLSFPGDADGCPKSRSLGVSGRKTRTEVLGKPPDPRCKQPVNPTRISKKRGANLRPPSLNLAAPGGSAPAAPHLARGCRFESLGTQPASNALGPGPSGVFCSRAS